MAKYQKGDKVTIKEGIPGSRLGGFPCKISEVDEKTLVPEAIYMVEYNDTATLGGKKTGIFFWVEEHNLEGESSDEQQPDHDHAEGE